jgi:ABC-type sugar transport system ATPase subunit
MTFASSAETAAKAPAAEPQLIVDQVFKQFGEGPGAVTAVDRVSFNVMPGEFVSVIGPSGCGKSTLFNIIGGLLGEYAGDVTVHKERISGPHPAIGMVFQEESTFPWRNVVENVCFPLELGGMAKSERIRKHLDALRPEIADRLMDKGRKRPEPPQQPAADPAKEAKANREWFVQRAAIVAKKELRDLILNNTTRPDSERIVANPLQRFLQTEPM